MIFCWISILDAILYTQKYTPPHCFLWIFAGWVYALDLGNYPYLFLLFFQYKKELVESFSKHAIDKFMSKQFQPIIDSVTTLDQVADAHTRMESNLNSGKIVMKVSESLLKDELWDSFSLMATLIWSVSSSW